MSKKLKINKDYPYMYETHLHTSEGSACGRSTGAEMARACKAAGYTGIMVTDHFFGGNTAIDRKLPWSEWVENYCKGYENAKKVGDEIGLQVFFGWEQSLCGGIDFLIYGLDKEWLLKHPEVKDATPEEQYKIVHEAGGLVIHAHPFREAFYIPKILLFPESVDGVEIINASHELRYQGPDKENPYDAQAKEYAKKHNFPETGGSDVHSVDLIGGGMAFSRKLQNVQDYMKAVMNREGIVLPGLSAFE